jgi:O-antigen/teichoic acid export membrane protein
LFSDLQRKLPIYLSQNRLWLASSKFHQTIVVAVGLLIVGLVGVVCASFFGADNSDVLFLGVLNGFSQQAFLIVTTESRSRGETVRFSLQNLVRSILILNCGFIAAVWYGTALEVIVAETTATLIVCAAIASKAYRSMNHPLCSIQAVAIRRVRTISPISMASLMGVTSAAYASANIDRWLAANRLSTRDFGQFAFASTLLTIATAIQSLINASTFPYLARRLGNHGQKSAFRVAAMLSGTILALSILAVWPTTSMAGLIIERYFPNYAGSLPAIPFILAAGCLRVSDFMSSYLIVAGFERRALACSIFPTLAALGIWLASISARNAEIGVVEMAVLTALLAASTFFTTAIVAWHATYGKTFA